MERYQEFHFNLSLCKLKNSFLEKTWETFTSPREPPGHPHAVPLSSLHHPCGRRLPHHACPLRSLDAGCPLHSSDQGQPEGSVQVLVPSGFTRGPALSTGLPLARKTTRKPCDSLFLSSHFGSNEEKVRISHGIRTPRDRRDHVMPHAPQMGKLRHKEGK